MTLYTIELNHKTYITTRYDKAWDFCLHYGAQIVSREFTSRVVDGIEYKERTLEEIYQALKKWLTGDNWNGEIHTDSYGFIMSTSRRTPKRFLKPLFPETPQERRYKVTEWPLDGE